MIDLKEEIRSLLEQIESQYKFDLIFAIQRKGMAHLKMIPSFREIVGHRLFFLEAMQFIEDKDLQDKNILIYDDACQTGAHLNSALTRFENIKCAVKTAALVVNEGSTFTPDFYRFILSGNSFKQLLSLSVDEYLGKHIYDDHLVLRITTKGGDYAKLLSSIRRLGQLTHVTRFFVDDIKAVSLEKFTFFDVVHEFEGLVERDGVEKIRLFFQKDGAINIVPRIYPAILLDKIRPQCQDFKIRRICRSLPSPAHQLENDQHPYIYSKCVIWAINASGVRAFREPFLDFLSRCEYKVVHEGINESDIRAALYYGDDAIKAIKELIGLEGSYE